MRNDLLKPVLVCFLLLAVAKCSPTESAKTGLPSNVTDGLTSNEPPVTPQATNETVSSDSKIPVEEKANEPDSKEDGGGESDEDTDGNDDSVSEGSVNSEFQFAAGTLLYVGTTPSSPPTFRLIPAQSETNDESNSIRLAGDVVETFSLSFNALTSLPEELPDDISAIVYSSEALENPDRFSDEKTGIRITLKKHMEPDALGLMTYQASVPISAVGAVKRQRKVRNESSENKTPSFEVSVQLDAQWVQYFTTVTSTNPTAGSPSMPSDPGSCRLPPPPYPHLGMLSSGFGQAFDQDGVAVDRTEMTTVLARLDTVMTETATSFDNPLSNSNEHYQMPQWFYFDKKLKDHNETRGIHSEFIIYSPIELKKHLANVTAGSTVLTIDPSATDKRYINPESNESVCRDYLPYLNGFGVHNIPISHLNLGGVGDTDIPVRRALHPRSYKVYPDSQVVRCDYVCSSCIGAPEKASNSVLGLTYLAQKSKRFFTSNLTTTLPMPLQMTANGFNVSYYYNSTPENLYKFLPTARDLHIAFILEGTPMHIQIKDPFGVVLHSARFLKENADSLRHASRPGLGSACTGLDEFNALDFNLDRSLWDCFYKTEFVFNDCFTTDHVAYNACIQPPLQGIPSFFHYMQPGMNAPGSDWAKARTYQITGVKFSTSGVNLGTVDYGWFDVDKLNRLDIGHTFPMNVYITINEGTPQTSASIRVNDTGTSSYYPWSVVGFAATLASDNMVYTASKLIRTNYCGTTPSLCFQNNYGTKIPSD